MAVKQMTGGTPEAPVFETTYTGAVLETRERNYSDDSDFYAVVWDEPSGTIKYVEYATTRGWTYLNSAVVDATPEVKAKARAYAAALALTAAKSLAVKKAKTPDVGKTVTVLKGKHAGKTGLVFWSGTKPKFHSYRGETEHRVGVDGPGGRFFTLASNAQVLDAEEWVESFEDLGPKVERWAQGLGNGSSWTSLDAQMLSDAFFGLSANTRRAMYL